MPLPPRKYKKRVFKPKAKAARKPAPKRTAPKKRTSSVLTIRQQNLGQQTESKMVLRAGRPDSRAPIFKAVGTMNHYVDTAASSISTGGFNGRQAWDQLEISTNADLAEIGLLLAPRQADSQAPPARYLLHNVVHNTKFSNVGQATCRLQIIHVRAKRDLYKSMNYTSPNGFSYNWDGRPLSAVQQGVEAAATGALTGGVRFLIPGVDETESPIFNSYFKVVKRTNVLLAVGGTHRLETCVSYDRVMDASVYDNDNMRAVLGVSDFLLFKAEGQTGVIQDSTTVSIAPCQIAYTQNWDYSFIQIANSKQFLDVFDPITATGARVAVISAATGSGVDAIGLIP